MTSDHTATGGGENSNTTSSTSRVKIEEIKPDDDSADQSCRTFVIHGEDHTLGNSLRY